jgi:hypothetical protein
MSDLERRSNPELDRGDRSRRKATLDSYACGDCHRPPNLFMVHDDLWVWHIPGLTCSAWRALSGGSGGRSWPRISRLDPG